jgi:hypothetical protein
MTGYPGKIRGMKGFWGRGIYRSTERTDLIGADEFIIGKKMAYALLILNCRRNTAKVLRKASFQSRELSTAGRMRAINLHAVLLLREQNLARVKTHMIRTDKELIDNEGDRKGI